MHDKGSGIDRSVLGNSSFMDSTAELDGITFLVLKTINAFEYVVCSIFGDFRNVSCDSLCIRQSN